MIFAYNDKMPVVHETAYVAPNAAIAGAVTIEAGVRIMFGAQVIAEGGRIVIGKECVILENAVLRSTAKHNLSVGRNCLIGPNAHVTGCTLEPEVFIATGASVFHGATLESECEVRINGVVHLKTHLSKGTAVPVGWVAVGDPPVIAPPDKHDAIWSAQEPLNFPKTVYGLERDKASVRAITQYLCGILPTDKM